MGSVVISGLFLNCVPIDEHFVNIPYEALFVVQRLDPNFGMRGSTTGHVSGFGGWPLGIMVGVDGRPTLVCSSPAQLSAEDVNASPSFGRAPTFVSKATYFCRLIPPDFELDPTFGTSHHITSRLPGGDFLLKSSIPGGETRMAEDQGPEDLALVGTNQVVASIVCTHPHPNFLGVSLDSPYLPLDGFRRHGSVSMRSVVQRNST